MAEDYWPNRATSENVAMTENALLESIDRRLGDQLKSMTDFHERTNKSLGETEAQMKVLTLAVAAIPNCGTCAPGRALTGQKAVMWFCIVGVPTLISAAVGVCVLFFTHWK